METLKYSKCAVSIGISVLVCLLPVHVIAQPGFISIACGGKTNHTDENNITWVTDAHYIDVGQTENTGNSNLPSYLQNQRFFPKPLKKTCYQLPVSPSVSYLLRTWFVVGNNSEFQTSFALSIETLGMLHRSNLTVDQNPIYYERILTSSGRVLYICLIKMLESDDPFINAIELRTLQDGMYPQAKQLGRMLSKIRGDYFGGNSTGGKSTVRYPQDSFDRLWIKINIVANSSQIVRYVSTQEQISTNNTKNHPPTAVMKTAWVGNLDTYGFAIKYNGFWKSLLVLYFAEIEMLNMSESRSFYVKINGERRSDIITLVPNYSALELPFLSDITNTFRFDMYQANNSTRGPILNAYEFYLIYDSDRATYSQDIKALEAVKRRFDIKDWISDPCYLMEWEGIVCDTDNNSSAGRILELNLSGRNLTGFIPEDIGQLNRIVNLSLDNNHLIGPLPNFSNLTKLERLHLQNNNFSGSVPEWLSELKNLKELFIENNHFSGVIPLQLLDRPSLKLKYSGNYYLCMHKGECIKKNQGTKKHKAVLGITISGAVLMALALMAGISIYWKQLGTKNRLIQDSSMITVQNPIISRTFILEEIVAATENFSRKIGQGGFGSVFFGRLAEGREIAVKVLSSFSKQGVHEFMNELDWLDQQIDLLSRVHHKNLVSLLGYCNESRELMLIYDYMSGGSLRDRLYGPCAELSKLNWRTRLKIALDAGQGLEYLHAGCNPKILHRDVKTPNILLDNNLNGKLADFGLSKMMAIDEEVTHVTTTVKGTPGYLDPEYFRTQMLTEKSDVYSFGVVLLEIICGKPPINVKLPEEERNLIQWVTPYVVDENPGEIAVIIDKKLEGNYDMKSITSIVKLALRCVEDKPSSRPSVSEVVAEIKEVIIHENEINTALLISERLDIQHGDFQPCPVGSRVESSGPKDMEWADDSCNFPQVVR